MELIADKNYSTHSNALKYTYRYNEDGNLIEMKQYYQEDNQFLLALTYQWDNFDEQKHVENAAAFYPFVHDLQYWKNNPGRRIVRDKNGAQTSFVEKYRYTYDSKGNPTSKTTETIADKSYYSICYYSYTNF